MATAAVSSTATTTTNSNGASTSASSYILNDYDKEGIETEMDRLNTQHYLFDDMMDNQLLPPHITKHLQETPSPRVCEIATGTGIWLSELSKQLSPSAELVGLDFDPTKFPAPETLPSNVKLSFGNAFEPFPQDLIGKFDVVHLRLFVFAMKTGQGPALIENLLTLLRPGGYLVWVDSHPLIMEFVPPQEATRKWKRVFYEYAKRVDLNMDIPLAITGYMRQAGLVDCEERWYSTETPFYGPKGGAEWRARQQRQAYIGIQQALKGMFLLGGIEGVQTKKEVDDFTDDLKGVFTDGKTVFYMPTIRAWGRKS
ncbi:S-adenosyl-L-methionine-dependent methyltransferase [Poronia punctata]|nr:S-adenosyl-L-methionine-dependent methyltransferase [Poronia punctata]